MTRPRCSSTRECRFFTGMEIDDMTRALGISAAGCPTVPRTPCARVNRRRAAARAWRMRSLPVFPVICVLLFPGALRAQPPRDAPAVPVPFSHMHARLERTFLKIDVLELDVCVDAGAARRIGELVGEGSPRAVADSITRAVLRAHEAHARVRMLRDVGLDRFIDGVVAEQRHAVQAGLLDDSTHQAVRAALPDWFSALSERGLHRDDEIVYAFRADTVRTTYISAEGDTLFRRTATGWPRRTSVLATYFAPGSSFRDGLIDSLYTRARPASTVPCTFELGLEDAPQPTGESPNIDEVFHRRLRRMLVW